MTDPKRLLWTCDSDFERTLLRAGRPAAPEGARERALLAASAALAASSVAAAGGLAAGNAAAGLKVGSLAALKWVGLFSLAGMGVGVATAAVVVRHAHQTAPPPNVVASAVSRGVARVGHGAVESPPVMPATSAASELAPAAPSHIAPPPPAASARSAPRTAEPGASTLPAEVALLEHARAAMGAGEPSRALSILDGYIARFPHGAMAREAAVLRIEALLRAGDRGAATRFANAFLAIEPHSPYAARIQSLLTTTNP